MPDSSVVSTANPLVIAICGGGIAGLSAAVTLQRLPNVQIHVFEQATAFREVRILNHIVLTFSRFIRSHLLAKFVPLSDYLSYRLEPPSHSGLMGCVA